jgi:signal transduction histidine kinase
VLASISDGLVVISRDWRIIYVNAAAERILRCDAASLLGRDHWHMFSSAVGTDFEVHCRRAMADGSPVQFEHYSTVSGRWYHMKVHPSELGLTLAISDVTSDPDAHAARRITEERFRLAASNSSITLYEQDRELRYTWLYPVHPEHSHALGRSDADFDVDGSRRDLMAMKREVMSRGVAMRREIEVPMRDGKRCYELFVSPRRDTSGVVIGVAGAAVDITARKEIEHALRESEERLKTMYQQQELLYRLVAAVNRAGAAAEIYEAALDALCQALGCRRGAILLHDAIGVMRFVAWRGLSDAYRAAVEGHSPWAADDPDPQPVCIADVRESPLDGALRSVVEAEGIRALAFIPLTYERRLFGKLMIYFDAPHVFGADDQKLAEAIARQVGFAIERRRASDELESLVTERTASLQEAIGQMEEFSYTVSHDLKSPVRGIVGYLGVILEDYGETLNSEVRAYLGRILQNAHRMDALVQDTLAYSRVARRELELSPLGLDEVVREAVAGIDIPAGATITLISPLGRVRAHEVSLVQAVSNLVLNAVKFVRPGALPRVVIRSERVGDRVRLRVEDEGIGVRPELQSRLFRIFERLHPDAGFEGTGIGLAIVRKAAERMGGRVGAISDGQSGSTFWIELPAAEE